MDKKLGVTIRPPKAEITAENKSYLQTLDVLIDTIHTQKRTKFTPFKCGIISTVTASLNNASLLIS